MQIQSSCSSSSSSKCTKVCRTCQNLSLASCHSNLDICFWYGLPVPRLLSWGLRLLLVELESSWLSNPQTAAYLPHLSRCEHEENQNQRTPFVKSETLQQDTCLSMWSQTSFPIEEKILHAFQWAQALERCTYRHLEKLRVGRVTVYPRTTSGFAQVCTLSLCASVFYSCYH